MLDWIETSGIRILAIAVGVWLFNRFGTFLIRKALQKAITSDNYASEEDETRREETLVGIIATSMKVATWSIATLIVLSEFGFNVGPLLAGAGVLGLALAFGAQELIKDFITGIFIVMENQYRVGDVVELDGISGTVTKITMRTTVLRDLDGNLHYFPNGHISHSANKTMDYSSINMNIGVSYEDDLDKVEKVINKVGKELSADEKWKADILEPVKFVRVNEFGDSAIEVKVNAKTEAGRHWAVAGEFRKRLKLAFDEAGIEIPFPQRVIHESKHKKE